MSQATEDALWAAITDHVRDEQVIGADELIVAWIIPYCAELPTNPNAARYGHIGPAAQRYHVGHGLLAGTMAAFNSAEAEDEFDA